MDAAAEAVAEFEAGASVSNSDLLGACCLRASLAGLRVVDCQTKRARKKARKDMAAASGASAEELEAEQAKLLEAAAGALAGQ